MTTWEFDVGVTRHAWLRRGVPVVAYRRVTVLAADYLDASLTAYAMAAGPDDAMVTELLLRV